jgi:hypothetical protein
VTRSLFSSVMVALLVSPFGQASTAAAVLVPNDAAEIEGASENLFPFDSSFNTASVRYQQVFASSQFVSVQAGGALITQLAFRPDIDFGHPFVQNHGSVQVELSTTTKLPHALSTTFSDNIGADVMTVFGPAPLTLSSGYTGPPNGPKAFDVKSR